MLSSPQAAKVFVNAWKLLNKPHVKVVALGVGTSKPLIEENLYPLFEPTEATAECLAATCPTEHGLKVLYPTSQLADNTLVSGLQRRGFKVHF
jgi:uroporphyrinogen-III synthase